MAPAKHLHVWRYLGALLAVLLLAYAYIFAGGHEAKLGLDLQGGQSVILTPRLEGGGNVDQDQLDTSVEIIRQRVNGTGVAEAEVVTQGDNIVISIPGGDRNGVPRLGSTAQLRFREVLEVQAAVQPDVSASPNPSGSPTAPSASTTIGATPGATAGAASPSPRGRALPSGLLAAAASTSAPPKHSASASPSSSATPAGQNATTEDGKILSGAVYTPEAFAELDCSDPDVRAGGSPDDKPDQEIVACDREGGLKYHLQKAAVVGTDVDTASAQLPVGGVGDWQVVVDFTGEGQRKFTTLTEQTTGKQVAIVLDGVVISAPTINERIDTDAQITGDFTQDEAKDLANVLKFGALPLTFETSQALSVSPTLGQDQLDAGLLAGAVGLILVVIYSLFYYRGMGLVTVASLAVAAAMTYGAVVLLGEWAGFTMTLAGIAGLIVSIGITADSFVVFFERIKDEVRDGRSLRASADRAWVRARRTILAADFVQLLAAVILYFLAIGAVRGFAFTLGLVTLIDIAVIFLFTRPMVTALLRTKLFSNGKVNGLGRVHAAEPAGTPQLRAKGA